MRASEAYPSKYLKAGDLRGNNVKVVIDRVVMEDIGDSEKPVIFFVGKEKGLVLNKTNANNIVILYGDEMDDWSAREIVLFPAMVDFQGRTVEAIRVRGPRANEKTAVKPAQHDDENPAPKPKAKKSSVDDPIEDPPF